MLLLEARNITKSFAGIQVLHEVNFELRPGEIHCLVGENGAGKSTLVKVLTGVYPDYGGEIVIEGSSIRISSPRASRKAGIFTVQQHRDLVLTLNAVENIFLGNEKMKGRQKINMSEMKVYAQKLIKGFNIEINLDAPVRELKVSEQEIVAICKALAVESKILLIDEASAPLDDAERQLLYSILKNLRNKGCGIVYISHHLDEIFKIGDRVTVMRDGKSINTLDVDKTDRENLIDCMVGNKKVYSQKENAFKHLSVDVTKETPILEFKDVNNQYLYNINFRIYKGEVIGFAGLAGANRSRIAEAVFGLCPVSSGEIKFKGKPINVKHPIYSIRLGCGLVPEDRKRAGILGCRSVAENVVITDVNKLKRNFISSRWMKNTTQQFIKRLNIKTSGVSQQVEYLSGGNQQKVLLAKWLDAKSELLFLIEPTAGIDVGARMEIYKILQELVLEGKTLVIVSSDIDELMTLCNRIFTMVNGRIINEYMTCDANKRLILSDILSQDAVS